MITFIKEVLKTTRFLVALALVTASLWVLVAVMIFSVVWAYRSKAHYNEARSHYHRGKTSEATDKLNAALKSDPGFVEAYCLAGKMALEAKDYKNAATYFGNAAKFGGPDAEVQNALAVTRIMSGFFPGAALDRNGKNALSDAASRWPGRGDTFVNLGSVLLYENDLDGAQGNYEKAQNTRNVSKRGLVHLYNGLGVVLTNKAKKATGRHRRELVRQAQIEFRKAQLLAPSRTAAGTNQLMTLLALAADIPVADRRLGIAVGRAEAFYGKNRKHVTKPFVYALSHNAGLHAYGEKRYEDAARAFERALKVAPLSAADAFNSVAATVAAAREDSSDEAVAAARGAVKGFISAPSPSLAESFALLTELGNVEYARKNLPAARECFEQAQKLINDTTPQTHAATVYRALAILGYEDGNISQTLAMIERAAEADALMTDFEPITERLKTPPKLSPPVVLRREDLPENMQPVRVAQVYNRSTSVPLKKKNIKVKIGDVETIFGFTKHSQMIALPKRPLGEGKHVVLIEATDPLGNTSSVTTMIIIDHTPPSASVRPPPGRRLTPGPRVLAVTLKDEVSGVSHVHTTLSVTHKPAGGDVENLSVLIREGKFTKTAGLDRTGVMIDNDRFSFQIKGGLVPGRYTFNLTAADKKGNKMKPFRWTYTVAEGTKR